MEARKRLPIGNDDFAEIRRNHDYYIDKSLLIKEFLETRDTVALIARPRRFGKTLNMTMLRDFFDITKDSRELFEGLAIMDTAYAFQINSRPVIYLTMKDCKGTTMEEMLFMVKQQIYQEYLRYEVFLRGKFAKDSFQVQDFYHMIEVLRDPYSPHMMYSNALRQLIQIVKDGYGVSPILLIDEYDQPIISSYEYGYREQVGTFFSNLYGSAMKGNPALGQALLTGVQRVAKESIFSQFNNVRVYTVLHKPYASYFGLTEAETEQLLKDYGLELNDAVKKKYDGYVFGGVEMYNPWSLLNYADMGELGNYWVNTSSNYLVREALSTAGRQFWDGFDRLVSGEEVSVWLTLETSYVERDSSYSLWGLLVNSGYLAAVRRIDDNTAVVRIPNDEVMAEFQILISEISGVNGLDLQQMLSCLIQKDMERFFALYQKIVISCTSYMDAKENAYHMLFLGMCIALRGTYRVTSNLESGHGRSDIMLQALKPGLPHIIVEFKQGEDIKKLKNEALNQILEQKYYEGLAGTVICVGLAHDKKRCEMAYREMKL